MKLHHIGYAVRDICASSAEFERLGYRKCSEVTEDKLRDVRLRFMEKDGHVIELVAPLSDSAHINNILKKTGSGPYHFCYEVKDLDEGIRSMLENGYVLIENAAEATAIGNRRVAFLFSRELGILELLEA